MSSEVQIQQFRDITQAPSSVAISYIQRYGTVDSAMNAYYETNGHLPDLNSADAVAASSWDEGQFHQDKTEYGPVNKPDFKIHAPDTLGPSVFAGGGPSRPPSRVSVMAGSQQGFDEDETMQQAISMSISQNLNEQESGVIQPSEATFSKAERRFYDSQQWSMTFAPHRSREVMQTPDPEHRKREAGAPAVLKPSSSKHYLPQLLTILHAIPMAKEALLARDRLLSDYGMSGDWWSGTAIQDTKIILVEEPAEASAMEDIIFEAQRIMAFLEQTERAYGSAEALALTEGVKNYIRDGTSIQETFLSTWQRAMESCGGESALSGIFQSKAVTYGNQDQMDDEPDIKPFSALAMDSPHEQLESGATLYDAFDALLWGVYDNTGIENTFLEFGDVLVMEWRAPQSDGSGIGIKIPAVWYVDRYLKESIEEATAMRKEKAFLRETIGQIKEVQSNFTMIQDPERLEGKFDARELLDAVRPLLIPQIEEESTFATKLDGHYALDQALDTTMSLTELVKELQIIADRVTEKYKALEEHKERVSQEVRELSKLLTRPSDNADASPNHKYTLRGVSTDYKTIFVLSNPNTVEDLIDTEVEDWQWWKITYLKDEATPISCEKVREIEVLHATKDAKSSALLVYASDAAVSYETEPLPPQLRNFVRADNLFFTQEQEKAAEQYPSDTVNRETDYDGGSPPNWGGWKENAPSPLRQREIGTNLDSPNHVEFADQNPPPYSASFGQNANPPPTPPRSTPSPPHSGAMNPSLIQPGGFDDTIPISITHADGYENVDLLGDSPDIGQEMQERKGLKSSFGIVPGGTGAGVGEGALGAYVPEISMDDVDDVDGVATGNAKARH